MSTAAVIGLDLGTTGARAVLADISGATLAVHESPYELLTPRPGWAEQSPEAWEEAAFAALAAVASQAERADDVRAIGLTGQMHGLTLLDRAQRPLRDAILWCDLRTGPQRRELEREAGCSNAHPGTRATFRWKASRPPSSSGSARMSLVSSNARRTSCCLRTSSGYGCPVNVGLTCPTPAGPGTSTRPRAAGRTQCWMPWRSIRPGCPNCANPRRRADG